MMKVGERYDYTYSAYRRDGITHPPTTVRYTVMEVDKRVVYIKFDNGSPNKFSIGSPMYKDSVKVAA
jgi:hypothetical protein